MSNEAPSTADSLSSDTQTNTQMDSQPSSAKVHPLAKISQVIGELKFKKEFDIGNLIALLALLVTGSGLIATFFGVLIAWKSLSTQQLLLAQRVTSIEDLQQKLQIQKSKNDAQESRLEQQRAQVEQQRQQTQNELVARLNSETEIIKKLTSEIELRLDTDRSAKASFDASSSFQSHTIAAIAQSMLLEPQQQEKSLFAAIIVAHMAHLKLNEVGRSKEDERWTGARLMEEEYEKRMERTPIEEQVKVTEEYLAAVKEFQGRKLRELEEVIKEPAAELKAAVNNYMTIQSRVSAKFSTPENDAKNNNE